jgi:hypothetical protein
MPGYVPAFCFLSYYKIANLERAKAGQCMIFLMLFCIFTIANQIFMSGLSIHTKIDTLPDNLKQQVSDFIDFLVEKSQSKKERIVPKAGSAKGKIKMAPDFDEPLDDFKAYM